ncbi:hypothetical protein [Streptosporangium carneum]|uniref:hypothetical protein n=1 Tax=Streptosporangium carneum TaxID=47481 RepID=UPI0022F2DC95|nr:hypothetical protein [Streptosporangium carneum]
MNQFERYTEEFCSVSRRQLGEELQEYDASLLDLFVSEEEDGIWATATVSLPGTERPWRFRSHVAERTGAEGSDILDCGSDDASVFTTHLTELLAARPWPPPESWPAAGAPGVAEEESPGSVEAWPGGPHVKDVDLHSLRVRNSGYIKDIYLAAWRPLFESICKDPWRTLKPEFTEDAAGIRLEVSMYCKVGEDRRRWSHKGLVLDAADRCEPPEVVGRRFVTQAVQGFERESRRRPSAG